MGDIKLFSIDEGNTHELRGESLAVEKSLQQVIENNAEKLLGINFWPQNIQQEKPCWKNRYTCY